MVYSLYNSHGNYNASEPRYATLTSDIRYACNASELRYATLTSDIGYVCNASELRYTQQQTATSAMHAICQRASLCNNKQRHSLYACNASELRYATPPDSEVRYICKSRLASDLRYACRNSELRYTTLVSDFRYACAQAIHRLETAWSVYIAGIIHITHRHTHTHTFANAKMFFFSALMVLAYTHAYYQYHCYITTPTAP